jgi:multidrug resistance efflux pump
MNIQRQLDDSEDTIEKLKAERDEAERNLEQTMKELGEIA